MHLKQKEVFGEPASKIIHEIQNLSEQIDCNNLTYYFRGNSAPKYFIVLNVV